MAEEDSSVRPDESLPEESVSGRGDVSTEEALAKQSSATGIESLDEVLGGGLPKGAVNLVAGSAGSGKTIFSFQWLFEGVTQGERGVYVTFTEPRFKSIANIEDMEFYDRDALENDDIVIADMHSIYEEGGIDPEEAKKYIVEKVKENKAKRLCIDSITAISYSLKDPAEIRRFIFELGTALATLGCTTVLTSELAEDGLTTYEVEEFISDVIIRLRHEEVEEETERSMRIVKVRGRGYDTAEIFFKISDAGITAIPKMRIPLVHTSSSERISTGIDGLDNLLLGGVFKTSSTLLAGSTGTGKSVMSLQFLLAGLENGEKCLLAGFEESERQVLRNAESFGWDLQQYVEEGLLEIRCAYPQEMFLKEHLDDIQRIVEEGNIQRCVIDSLSSISHAFPAETFTPFAKRMHGYLKDQGVTTYYTAATSQLTGTIESLTEKHLSTMTDNIIMMRHVEMEGELQLVLNVIKTRGSDHEEALTNYEITGDGIKIGQSMAGYEGVMTGVTRKVSETVEEKLSAAFKQYIGPMWRSVYEEVEEEDLTREHVMAQIDDLEEEGIIKEDDADLFRREVEHIFEDTGGET